MLFYFLRKNPNYIKNKILAVARKQAKKVGLKANFINVVIDDDNPKYRVYRIFYNNKNVEWFPGNQEFKWHKSDLKFVAELLGDRLLRIADYKSWARR